MTCAGCEDCAFTEKTIPSDIHEIHVTVSPDEKSRFLEFCSSYEIKPIVVHTISPSGRVHVDLMTSHRFQGSNTDAYNESARLEWLIRQDGMTVLRSKIETTQTNPVWAGQLGYWESHTEFSVPDEDDDIFRELVYARGGRYLSRSPKKSGNGRSVFMVTVRSQDPTPTQFEVTTSIALQDFDHPDIDKGKTIIEYCWKDSNINHDDDWMRN